MVFYTAVNTIRDYVGGTYIYIYMGGGKDGQRQINTTDKIC